MASVSAPGLPGKLTGVKTSCGIQELPASNTEFLGKGERWNCRDLEEKSMLAS